MSVLTMQMLRDAAKKMRAAPPAPVDIMVGSSLRFKAYLEAHSQYVLQEPKPHGSFAGLPIKITNLVPEHMAVVMGSEGVLFVIDFDKPNNSHD